MTKRISTIHTGFCAALLALVAVGCAGGRDAQHTGRAEAVVPGARPVVSRVTAVPTHCSWVRAGEPLQARIDTAATGATLCLADGRYDGPILLTRPLVIWGARGAVIASRGTGTTIEVKTPQSALLGFTIEGSGSRYDLDDAAVKVSASDVRIEGLHIVDAMFGILVSLASRVTVRANEIEGRIGADAALRGDSLRFWETRDSLIEGNHVRHGRDSVLWYSSHNVFVDNVIEGGRYGAHLMYSHDNHLSHNTIRGSIVGTFVMYSRGLRIEDNAYLDSSSAAGMGVGLKESGNITIARNTFVHASTGLYVDTSPLQRGDADEIARNRFVLCDRAVVFHGRADANTFHDNTLLRNRVAVATEGGGDALSSTWRHNAFDDYEGYDLDDDGTGDVPYESRSLSAELVSARPALKFFSGTPAMGIVDAAGELVPLFAPRVIVRDVSPRVDSREEGAL